MSKVAMNNVDKGILLSMISGEDIKINIPKVVKVVDFQTGDFDRGGDKGVMYWANLSVVDSEELALLEQVGLLDNANELKMKISNYQNENLDNLIGVDLKTSGMDVVFTEKNSNRGSEITGLAFKTDLNEIKGAK